jgi:putative ABC transport system substrate-binding protein
MRRRDFITLLSGTTAWPLTAPFPAAAQNATKAVIGLLTTAPPGAGVLVGIQKGLGERGYVEGRNVTIIARSAGGNFERLPVLAAELVAAQVSVILAQGGPDPARAAKAATGTIPIVFVYGGDPVLDGLVASLNRPGGNVTGATFIGTALVGKALQLLRELLPGMAEVALLVNRRSTIAELQIKAAEAAAPTLGLRLRVVDAGSAGEIDKAFETIAQAKVDALLVSTDPTLGNPHSEQIIALAARYRIPAIYSTRREDDAGALMSYGASVSEAAQQAAVYVGRILDGEKPSDLPVLQPTTFRLVINLGTAKALGLTVPPTLLARADETIE